MTTFQRAAHFFLLCGGLVASGAEASPKLSSTDTSSDVAGSAVGRWTRGLATDPAYFPIAVWLQSTRNAARYKAAGINLYVAVWRGPTAEQLAELETAGVSLICGQSRAALEQRDRRVIVGWMHGDEPDNAQSLGQGKGYGPPILPERIVEDYERIRAADPSRPVLLNLGQGVAWDSYIGRGVRRNHPEDYPQYLKGCDIASFDIYPVVHDAPEIAGKLEYVAAGVGRLGNWSDKPVWNCIECTHISNPAAKATPLQIRSEVWMSLIHGSRGLIYFVHQFKPVFKEAALLDDPENLAAVTAINHQIMELAPALNAPTVPNGVNIAAGSASANAGTARIAFMQKRVGPALFLFTVNMRNEPARATVTFAALPGLRQVDVLGERRQLAMAEGQFADDFKPYEVHLYSVTGQ